MKLTGSIVQLERDEHELTSEKRDERILEAMTVKGVDSVIRQIRQLLSTSDFSLH